MKLTDARIPMSLAILFTVAGAIVNITAGPFDADAHAVADENALSGNVLFADDFSRDPLGAAPRRWSLEDGEFEVAARGERQWVGLSSERGEIRPNLMGQLPRRWALEFEAYSQQPALEGLTLAALDVEGRDVWTLELGPVRGADVVLSADGVSAGYGVPAGKPGSVQRRVEVTADGQELRLEIGGAEIVAVADIGLTEPPIRLALRMTQSEGTPLVGNVRVLELENERASRE